VKYDPTLDVGKCLGAFFISGVIHSAASASINGGDFKKAGEFYFFTSNGVAVVLEEIVKKLVRSKRRKAKVLWYDVWIGKCTYSILIENTSCMKSSVDSYVITMHGAVLHEAMVRMRIT